MAKKKRGLIDRLVMGSEKSEGYARASLPSNRWELFWDIFKGRFGKLFIINLLVILFCLPTIVLFILRYMSIANYGVSYPFSQSFGVGYGALPSMFGASENIILMVNLTIYLFSPIVFCIAGIGIAGAIYVLRNMVWTEGIFVANDFWYGIKKNFKQFMLIMLLYSVVFYLTNLSIAMCNRTRVTEPSNAWLYKVFKVVTYILLITFSVMTLHMLAMSTTYTLKLRQLIKNSFIFAFALLPNNALFIGLALIPFLLLLLDGLFMFIGIVMVFIFGFSVFLLIWINYSQWVYLLSEEPATQRYEYDLIRQIKANNNVAAYVAVSQSVPSIEADYFDLNVVIGAPAEVERCYKAVSYVIVAQLLGFYKALDLKRSPDNPSVSGNISRVVEGVTIYE